MTRPCRTSWICSSCCVEAGLSLQSTLNRVSDEVRPISMDLYHELHLTNAELRTGITRETALKNLGERTGVQTSSPWWA